jgi:hypothetical protein
MRWGKLARHERAIDLFYPDNRAIRIERGGVTDASHSGIEAAAYARSADLRDLRAHTVRPGTDHWNLCERLAGSSHPC